MKGTDWATDRGEKWSAHRSGMEATLAPVDEPLLAALALDASLRIAEVGCGGGGTSFAILARARAGSVVHAFDISPKLVEVARGRLHPDDRTLVFDVADMASAAPAERYDRLVSRFGVMFFEDPAGAFANLARWLEPKGRFAFAVWGPLSDNPWMTTVRDVVARIVTVPRPDPEAPGPFRYADPSTLLSLLDRAGFADVAVQDWRGGLPIGGALSSADAASFALASFSSFGELLTQAGDRALDEARSALTTHFSDHAKDGAIRLGARVHIVTGRGAARG